jgi:hypothetical protein
MVPKFGALKLLDLSAHRVEMPKKSLPGTGRFCYISPQSTP